MIQGINVVDFNIRYDINFAYSGFDFAKYSFDGIDLSHSHNP